jgi:hypothetical protein
MKRPTADKSFRVDSGEKRERKLRPHAVPEKNQSVPLDCGIGPLRGQWRNRILDRNPPAGSVGGVLPMMEGTLKTVPDNLTTSQVGRQV